MSDYTVGETLHLMFTTRAITGVPTVLSGSPVVSAYEADSATQITAGITLGVDHDSVAGLNLLTIVATGGNGFESGKDYNLVITTGTVNSVSAIGEVVGTFSLGRSAAAVELANATDGLSALKALVDTLTTNLATVDGIVDSILVDTGTTIPATIATVDTNVDSILVDTGTTLPASIATVDGNVDAILVDTADLQANQGSWLTATGFATSGALATVDSNVDAVLVDTGTTLPATLADIQGATFATGTDSLEAIRNRGDAAWTTGAGGTAPTVAEIRTEMDDNSTKLAAIVADTGELQTNQGNWLTATGFATSGALATVDSNVDAILVDTNELQTDDIPAAIAALNDLSAAQVNAEVDTALTDIHLDHLFATNYDPASKPGTATALLNEIVENDGGVSRFTVNSLENAPSGSGASAATIADAVWTEVIGDHSGVSGSTAEALDSASAGGGLDAAGVRTALGLASANLDTQLSAIDTVVDSVLVDTAEIGAAGAGLTALATASALAVVDGVADAILVDTGTTIPNQITALNDLSAAEVNAEVDTALGDYDAPTKAELDSGLAALNNFDPASDTVDVGKLNGSAEAAADLALSAATIVSGAAAVGTLSTTVMTTNLTEATDDHYNGRQLLWTSGVLEDQATGITDYNGTSKALTFTAVTEAPSNGDTFVIV